MDLSKTQKLSPKVINVWRITALIVVMVVGAIIAVFSLIIMSDYYLSGIFFALPVILIAILFVIFVIIIPIIRYKRFSYMISDDEIAIKQGIIIITTTIVPMIKIQYTDTTQGPIMRHFKLAAIKIMTAGGTVSIPGLPINDAENWRDQITSLVKTVKENV